MWLAHTRALPGGPQFGAMIDESTSVVDDDLTDFGAKHFSSPFAYHVHRRPMRSRNARGLRPFDVPCDWRVSFPSASLPIASILTGCNPGCPTERSREARQRGEPRFDRYLRKRQLAGCDVCHSLLQAQSTDIAVGRNAHGEGEHSRKMERAESRDLGQFCNSDLVGQMHRNIIENATPLSQYVRRR
jgi:hypothetical protein